MGQTEAGQGAGQQQDTLAAWLAELDYITGTAKRRAFASFNGDRECFGRYVHMQADACSREGYVTTAASMRRALLMVQP